MEISCDMTKSDRSDRMFYFLGFETYRLIQMKGVKSSFRDFVPFCAKVPKCTFVKEIRNIAGCLDLLVSCFTRFT
jgi:hypothetical protein